MLFKKIEGFKINNNIVNVNNDIKKLWKLFILLWLIKYSYGDSTELLYEYIFVSGKDSEERIDNISSPCSGSVNNTLTIFK